MVTSDRPYRWLPLVIMLGICIACPSNAADITAAIGDKIPLSGTSVGTDWIYLFVTGPGLPQDGVNPGRMQVPSVTGMPDTFSMVDASSDHWSFIWNTARQGFELKEGIYTVYAVKTPVNKADLGGQTYGSTTIALTYGGGPLVTTGKVLINSTPVRAEVYLNNQLYGLTPQNLDIPPGTYAVQLMSRGYKPFSQQVAVAAGSTIEINGIMVPLEMPVISNITKTAEKTPVVTSPVGTVQNSAEPTKSPLTPWILVLAIGIASIIFVVRREKE
ncbi:MAG TPA: PEGA domain-containing protein [Methanoregulaceae archaeon]|nr:PEGA domain-containing protein [Methanoregulaceae archaeon]